MLAFQWANYGCDMMSGNFHEAFRPEQVKPPSQRSTGLVFAGVALVIAAVWRHSPTTPWVALAISGALATVSLAAPALLKPLNIMWFRFGLLIHRFVNPIIMFVVFGLVFVPAGYLMRLWRDPLRSKRATARLSYWIERKENEQTASSMRNQF